jgi:hypothetical protein
MFLNRPANRQPLEWNHQRESTGVLHILVSPDGAHVRASNHVTAYILREGVLGGRKQFGDWSRRRERRRGFGCGM